jgi:seryl-tRNA(Sec) selenium transferase
VINATGVILHTNLGRAPLADAAADRVAAVARGYSTLEYDVAQGARGRRDVHAAATMIVRPMVAAVYLNRFRIGMARATCGATISRSIRRTTRLATRDSLRARSPRLARRRSKRSSTRPMWTIYIS